MPQPDRRTQILDAALGCFLARGYLATTIGDIRAASGASTGSIYHFFAGKGALAQALLAQAVAGWSAAAPGVEDVAPEQAIKASVAGLITWGMANPQLLRFMDEIRTMAATDPDFAEVQKALTAGQVAGAGQYAKYVATGAVRPLPWPVAHSLILGSAYNYLRLGSHDLPPSEAATVFAEAAWNAVKTPVAPE